MDSLVNLRDFLTSGLSGHVSSLLDLSTCLASARLHKLADKELRQVKLVRKKIEVKLKLDISYLISTVYSVDTDIQFAVFV